MESQSDSTCSYCSLLKTPKYKLLCGDFLCSDDCFSNLISLKTEGRLEKYELVTCNVCSVKVDRSLLVRLFGSEENFRREINISSKRFETKITCDCCYLDKPISEFITLDCDHRMCEDCVRENLNTLVNEGKVGDDVSCFQCSRAIDYNIIVNVLDQDMRDKYDKFLLRKLETHLKNEVYITCVGKPGVDCEFGQFISVDREEYTCPKCGASFCAKCKKSIHPKITCKQAKEREGIDIETKKSIEMGQASFCPWCDVLIYKDKGCKYIICTSPVCQGKRGFCWDCKTKLTQKHETHPCHTPDVISNRLKKSCIIF
jgi:IBR domain, a half RING-finger domain